MKVIYFLSSPTKHGGANISFINMLDGLIDKGVKPLVILPFYGDLVYVLKSKGVECLVCNYCHNTYPPVRHLRDIIFYIPRLFRTFFYNYLAINKISKKIKLINPDLIHTNVGPVHIGYKIAQKHKIPHVWHIREYQNLDFNMHPIPSMQNFIGKLNSDNNYSIAITCGLSHHFSLNSNSKVIYNPVFKKDRIQFIDKKEKYFLFAGRLGKSKGVENLIIAFSEFTKNDQEYFLYIAGDTSDIKYRNSLLSLVEEFGITNRVKFLGVLDDVSGLMAYATALIVPSVFEGFGRITAEAMFNGCLVIGNNTGGTKEILERENLGILYSGHHELVSAMKHVVDIGIDKFFTMIKMSQKRATELYSNEQNIEAVFDYYEYALGRYKPESATNTTCHEVGR